VGQLVRGTRRLRRGTATPALALGALLRGDHGRPADRLGLGVQVDVGLPQLVERGVYVGGVAAGLGQLVELGPGLRGQLVQLRRQVEVVEALRHPAQRRVHEPVAVADRLAVGVQHVLQLQLLAHPHHGLGPVVEQVGVPHERPGTAVGTADRLTGAALGVQQHVQPRGGEVGRAEPVAVVGLLAAHHLGRWAEHRREDRRRAGADRRDPPQRQEPAQSRVLHHQLVTLGEVPREPVGGGDPLGLAGADPSGLEPRLRARVADLDHGLLEQPVVVVDHPARLAETLGVGLVGGHLGLGHVQAQDLHQPGQRAGPAAARAGHEEHLARVVGGVDAAGVTHGG
jgi:hypothetical protein